MIHGRKYAAVLIQGNGGVKNSTKPLDEIAGAVDVTERGYRFVKKRSFYRS